jgi:tetratricopeptide (TPR) repeat protein
MLDYLEQLIKERKWEEALILAEQLVQKTDNTAEDMVRINLALIIARSLTAEHAGVVTLGDHALGMAADVANWNAYLTMCHYVAFSHVSLNQLAQAQQYWLRYIENVDKYTEHHAYEISTWFNLGVSTFLMGDYESAVYYYEHAKRVTLVCGTKRQLLGVNHALISGYILLGQYDRVPRLLAQTAHYLRNNVGADEWLKAKFSHYKVRAEFALSTRRYKRARQVANRCLDLATDYPEHRYHMHMILAGVSKECDQFEEMARHLTAARVAAIRARRYDYELHAAEGLYHFMQTHPEEFLMNVEPANSEPLPLSWFELDESEGVK